MSVYNNTEHNYNQVAEKIYHSNKNQTLKEQNILYRYEYRKQSSLWDVNEHKFILLWYIAGLLCMVSLSCKVGHIDWIWQDW